MCRLQYWRSAPRTLSPCTEPRDAAVSSEIKDILLQTVLRWSCLELILRWRQGVGRGATDPAPLLRARAEVGRDGGVACCLFAVLDCDNALWKKNLIQSAPGIARTAQRLTELGLPEKKRRLACCQVLRGKCEQMVLMTEEISQQPTTVLKSHATNFANSVDPSPAVNKCPHVTINPATVSEGNGTFAPA